MKENDLILHYDVLLSVFRARGDRETSISLLPVQTLLIFLGNFIRAKSYFISTHHMLTKSVQILSLQKDINVTGC